MTGLAIALLALALLLFIAEAHAPTTVPGLLGVAALVGAGFAGGTRATTFRWRRSSPAA